MENIKNYIDYLKDENKKITGNIQYNTNLGRYSTVENYINDLRVNLTKIETLEWTLNVLESKGE